LQPKVAIRAIRAMKSVTAIPVMTSVIAILVTKSMIATHVILRENFRSENFSRVSNWRVVVMMVVVHPVTKLATAIPVMK
jgi:hypothetical protein